VNWNSDAISKWITTRGGAFLVAVGVMGALWTGCTVTTAAMVSWINRKPNENIERTARQLDTLSTTVRALVAQVNAGAVRDSIFAEALSHPLWSNGRQQSLKDIRNHDTTGQTP